jgi:hypothetical protein
MDSFLAQLNVRNNVRSMHDSVKELYDWEAEMNAKDEAIRRGQINQEGVSAAAIRGKVAIVQPSHDIDLNTPSPALAPGAT